MRGASSARADGGVDTAAMIFLVTTALAFLWPSSSVFTSEVAVGRGRSGSLVCARDSGLEPPVRAPTPSLGDGASGTRWTLAPKFV